MKILPVAINHCIIELDNGERLDINDGSSVLGGYVNIQLLEPTKRRLVVCTSTQYDATVRLLIDKET